MAIFHPQYWPIVFICVAMIASAVIDWWKFKVPNWLTMPVIVSGWLYGLLHNFGVQLGPEIGAGGLGASLAGTAVGSLLLLAYAIGGMGAGDVKMCMGFGAWMGAFYGFAGNCLVHTAMALALGVLVGGPIALVMILLRGDFRGNLNHTRAILTDLAVSGLNLSKIAENAHQRRPRWHRLPYGVPLCIGFLIYLIYVQPAAPRELAPPVDGQSWHARFPSPAPWAREGSLAGSVLSGRR